MVNIKINSTSKYEHTGGMRPIIFMLDAEKSAAALLQLHGKSVVDKLARLNRLLRKLNTTGRLKSPDEFRREHEENGVTFYAVRALPLRAYGWFCNDGFVVSHIIWKDQEKLSNKDKTRMERNCHEYIPPEIDGVHLRVVK